jgi:glycerol kinase
MSYILTLDIGTTNIKAFLFDKKGEIFAQARKRPNHISDNPGQVEQDPKEIWDLSRQVMEEVLNSKNLKANSVDSIAISTQRSSFLFWDKKSGEPLSNIITWQDKRCAEYARKKTKSIMFKVGRGIAKFVILFWKNPKMVTTSLLEFNTDMASSRTGWYLEKNPEIRKEIQDPETTIAWGQTDSWILWKLTEGKVHATDYSNAGTGLLDPFALKWHPTLMKAFKVPEHIMPELRETKGDFGTTNLFGGGEIPITAVIADQQASLFGQCCFNKGDLKVTNGTGSFVDINTGTKPFASKRRLYPMPAWKIDGEEAYLLEGMSHNTGNIIDWIQNALGFYKDPAESEKMALSVDSTNGVYFLPTFTSGISFPYWDTTARGNIFGISLETKKEHIVRAVLEGICFRIKDIVDGIKRDTKIQVKKMKADGGASQNKFLLQFLSDITGLTIELSASPESTALGAAFVAGLATGFWKSKEELLEIYKVDKVFTPQMSEVERKKRYSTWKNIISRSLKYEVD